MNKTNPKPAGEESEPRLPTHLRQALAATPVAKAQWRDLTPIARRDFISWIDSDKQPETRRRRIERACSMLAAGKRRPCCYSIVSFNLYTALAATPVAKAQWRDLTPIERRDFISWIDSAKQPETRRRRIEKACSMLAAGKRRPCCYSIVSLNLYTALAATPMAKAQWRDLTPIERRHFISWMDSAKQPEAHRRRIEKACVMLAAGKRRP